MGGLVVTYPFDRLSLGIGEGYWGLACFRVDIRQKQKSTVQIIRPWIFYFRVVYYSIA
jgi:hypothetical protein